jgi:hypothetical protein
MKSLLASGSFRIYLLSCLLLTLTTLVNAQNYWDKIPALTTQNYSDKDDYSKNIQTLRSEVKEKLDKIKKSAEEKANKMTDAEKMALATRYQNMKPDEIVKMQSEMMAITQAQADFQQASSDMENQFNSLESEFREAFGKRLGPIEAEYNKLPDGEGTPQWAIKKGEELITSYNKEYETICKEYVTAPDAKFKMWLKEFNNYLIEKEIPFNQKMIKMQYSQYGIAADASAASLMAVDRYLEKCETISGLRRPYPQG